MFPVTITLTTPAQLSAVMAALGAAQAPELPRVEAPAPEAAAKPAKSKPAPAAKVEPAAAEPEAVQKVDTPAAPAVEAPAAVTEYAPVGAAITAFAAAHGRQAALAKLAEFGVKSGKELKPDQWAAALAAFKVEA